jgi:hypothetical protein
MRMNPCLNSRKITLATNVEENGLVIMIFELGIGSVANQEFDDLSG